MLIGNRSPPKRPVVSVTAPASSKQVRIAFNAPLVRHASLQDVPYMAIEFDVERQRVTFISTPSREYKGTVAFPLMRDGGQSSSKTASKALYCPKNLLSMLHLQAPRVYEPETQRGREGTKISIALESAPASHAAPEDIPLRAGGVYRILDADATDLDIRRSKNEAAIDALAKDAQLSTGHLARIEKSRTRVNAKTGTTVFIGHRRSPLWRELKDFLVDRLHLTVDEFNTVPTAGVATVERLAEMLDAAVFAFLIMTAEDEQPDGNLRARENVVHEVGLFQGRLGFKKAVVLLEEGCEEFSNIRGHGQIPFPRGNISAKFEEIRRVLERERVVLQGRAGD
jgi:predicted nucleotide-binding protein